MVVWKKIATEGFGTGRNVRFGDLNGDGQIDILIAQVKNHGPKDRNSEVGCLTALTVDGRRLWQTGEADLWRDRLTSDVAVQVHDLDRDGKAEVVYCRDQELVIADGATGRAIRKIPTPLSPKSTKKNDPHNKFPRILGDSRHFLDLRGLETVTINFHANQGIVHFYDARMNVYHDCEPVQHGSMMTPLNWTGRTEEYFVLSPHVDEGVYDGWGRRVLRFPADGHPEMTYTVLDLTGDCRDEIVVWDAQEMWIYTQADNPKPGKLHRPTRNPLYNQSDYQANVSLPAGLD